MAGCSRCHNLNVPAFPIKDYRSGEIKSVCLQCMSDNELKMMRIIIADAYEKGKGL